MRNGEWIYFDNNVEKNKKIVQRLSSQYEDGKDLVQWLEGKYPQYFTYGQAWMNEAMFDLGAGCVMQVK